MFVHVDISFLIAFIDNSIITYGWRDTIGRGGAKAGMEIVLDVIQVVLAAILVVLVYKLYKKQ